MVKPKVINAKECPLCNIPKGWGHEIIFENNEMASVLVPLVSFKTGPV